MIFSQCHFCPLILEMPNLLKTAAFMSAYADRRPACAGRPEAAEFPVRRRGLIWLLPVH